MNDIFTVIVDKRLIQAVEYVKHRAGSRPEEIWKNVARYMNGLTPEQCSERYNYLVTEKQYAPLDYRPKVPMPDEELQVTIIDGDKKETMSIPRALLVNNMAYFRNILANKESTAIDLSIHSDICIFKWLMEHCYHLYQPSDYPPVSLTIRIVFPVLVSAHFLGMPNLVNDCILFMLKGSNFTQILSFNYNFSCMDTDLLKRFLEHVPLPIFIRYLGANHSNYLITKLANASSHSLLHKFSDKILFCDQCGHFCLQEILDSSTISKLYPNSTFLNCVNGCSRIDSRGRMTSNHNFRVCKKLSKTIQKHLADIKIYPKLTSVHIYWALFGLLFWCTCAKCEQVFPLQDLCKCEASGGQHTNHEIDKVIVAPADTDLRLTIKEDLFDLNKNIWNNLSIKSKLLNILDVPVIHNMITLGPACGNFSAVSVARSGQESSTAPRKKANIPIHAAVSEDSVSEEQTPAVNLHTPTQARPRQELSTRSTVDTKTRRLSFQLRAQKGAVQEPNVVKPRAQQSEPPLKAPDPDLSSDSQDSNDCSELQTRIFTHTADDDAVGVKGKATAKGLPERCKRYLKLKSSMTDEQRKTVLNGIAHEEDVSKLRALNSVLITARENDIIKKARYAFESIPFPTYNLQSRGK
ncbi:hypothetical protein GL50803_003594 [Giardia duodenalis]|uniref:Uncharacterized protein n=1 Tax=Giardia intestinalis (strain ATCC 50803 / WB clone C6) TaxID=184922 RepID=A8BPJ0_GIAIC|nr:hypothetical protein GL50803_003594 [Giardia intestinalis]KAE8303285.1 hypothetical protein GL50803_003594 [Giardia intestinalis]|eukprot:XP_001705762.1 Hypothetical protein GL50803_3594 [Giardia lamblia ATCC 50803]